MSTANELERDIESTRSRLNGTIERIQEKLTVSGIVDEVMGAAGVPRYQNGHEFVLGIMRRHPLPIMIAAAGIGFLFYRMNRRADSGEAIADADYVEITSLGEGQASGFEPTLPQTLPSAEPFGARTSLPKQP